MNAHERKKLRKQKRLVNLGREAQVRIAAAEGATDATLSELATRDAALATTLGKAKTLEEAVMLARVEATKTQAASEEAHAHEILALKCSHSDSVDTVQKQMVEMEQAHARRLINIGEEHARELVDLNNHIADMGNTIDRLRAEAEEPAKLRKRLQESQNKVAALQTEVSQLKKKVVEEVVVKFPRRKRRMEGAEGQ